MNHEPSVVLLGSDKNEELRLLTEELEEGEFLLLDDDWLSRNEIGEWRHPFVLSSTVCLGGVYLSPEKTKSIFFRPSFHKYSDGYIAPQLINSHEAVQEADKPFARAEAEAMLLGALNNLDALWINNPASEVLADLKLRQLNIAFSEGLRTPHTLVSNNVELLREFWHQQHGMVITKAVSAFPSRWLHQEVMITRRVTEDELELLSKAAPGPVLFQEFIPAALDVRVIVVGDQVFAAAIHSQEGDGKLDWRLDYSVRFTPFELDPGVARRILNVATRLDLVYGAADLRLTPEGEIVFFEYNSQGAYLFLEELAGIPITKSIVNLLRTGTVARLVRRDSSKLRHLMSYGKMD